MDDLVSDVAVDGRVEPGRVDSLWGAASTHPEFARLAGRPSAAGAIVRHSSSARRPVSQCSVLWVVVVASSESGGVSEAVAILSYGDAADEVTVFPSAPDLSAQPPQLAAFETGNARLTSVVAQNPTLWHRVGPANVWQDAAPVPIDGLGGTVVVSALSGRLLFASPTTW